MNSHPQSVLLAQLDKIERLAASDIACCAGCSFYWEDPKRVAGLFGFCRRRAPDTIDDTTRAKPCPAVDFDWFCGDHVQGVHPAVVAQRALWRQQLEQAKDSATER